MYFCCWPQQTTCSVPLVGDTTYGRLPLEQFPHQDVQDDPGDQQQDYQRAMPVDDAFHTCTPAVTSALPAAHLQTPCHGLVAGGQSLQVPPGLGADVWAGC